MTPATGSPQPPDTKESRVDGSKSFWQTLPGIITAITGLITALTGAYLGIHQLNSGGKTSAVNPSQTASGMSPGTGSGTLAPGGSSSAAGATTKQSADSIAGRWVGRATDPDTGPFDVVLNVRTGCTVGQACGEIFVSGNNCTGVATLARILSNSSYEFGVGNFTLTSGPNCSEGPGGEIFTLQADGKLRYTTDYGPSGTLSRE
jgi:hypothetical protein